MSYSEHHPISDETLMGYILMALPEEENVAIESRLLRDTSLAQRIADLRELLRPVEISKEERFEACPDLVSRTMALVNSQPLGSKASIDSLGQDSNYETACKDTKLAWMDSLVTVAAGVTLLCFLMPSIWYSREQARKLGCSENLRGLGGSFEDFARRQSTQEFPVIDISGPFAFAGVYSLKLKNAELLDSSKRLKCPSNTYSQIVIHIPSYKEYLEGTQEAQTAWQRTIGGTYAYNLGYLVDDSYVTPRANSGQIVPLIGDAVCIERLNSECRTKTHGFDCVNLLYSDGRVFSMRLSELADAEGIDHPYLNRNQVRAVGIGSDDTCIGPSFVAPIIQSISKQ